MVSVLRIILVASFLVLTLGSAIAAQTGRPIEQTIEQFREGLGSLKQSAEKLSVGNEALRIRNEKIKSFLAQMQQGQEISAGNELSKSVLRLRDENPGHMKQITQLEKITFDLNSKLEQLAIQIKTDKEDIERAEAEDARLTTQLDKLGINVPVDPVVESQVPASPQKEKLQLLKMIYESKQNQETLYRQINGSSKNAPSASYMADMAKRKQDLQDQIQQIEGLSDRKARVANSPIYSKEEMDMLEVQVKSLEKNHEELEELVDKTQEKVQKLTLGPDQRMEMGKLQGSLQDLTREGRGLKQDLLDLRQQMVELDKRKASLEALLRK